MAELKTAPATTVSQDEFEGFKQEVTGDLSAIKAMLERIAAVDDSRVRASRTQEAHANEIIHDGYDDEWEQETLLGNPALKARPGMKQMWIRTATGDESDGSNVARMFNRGWRPRLASSLPKDFQGSCMLKFDGQEVIGWRGTILCEMPEDEHQRRFIRTREAASNNLMRGIEENLMRDHDKTQRGFGQAKFTQRTRQVETGNRPAPVDFD
jgi:hypothetical protein